MTYQLSMGSRLDRKGNAEKINKKDKDRGTKWEKCKDRRL